MIDKYTSKKTGILNLYNILKGDEGKEFYSPCFGKLKLTEINEYNIRFLIVKDSSIQHPEKEMYVSFRPDGTYMDGGELMVYPAKDNKDWLEYDYLKRNCPGWDEYVKETGDNIVFDIIDLDNFICKNTIEKSAIAYIKLYKIIKHFYTNTDTDNIEHVTIDSELSIKYYCENQKEYMPLVFSTTLAAKDFLKNSKNVKLVKQYYNMN